MLLCASRRAELSPHIRLWALSSPNTARQEGRRHQQRPQRPGRLPLPQLPRQLLPQHLEEEAEVVVEEAAQEGEEAQEEEEEARVEERLQAAALEEEEVQAAVAPEEEAAAQEEEEELQQLPPTPLTKAKERNQHGLISTLLSNLYLLIVRFLRRMREHVDTPAAYGYLHFAVCLKG